MPEDEKEKFVKMMTTNFDPNEVKNKISKVLAGTKIEEADAWDKTDKEINILKQIGQRRLWGNNSTFFECDSERIDPKLDF